MLERPGANFGVLVNGDGVFIIDNQFAPISGKLRSTIKILSDTPLTFLVNTYDQGDHSDDNNNRTKASRLLLLKTM
jgi:cyclase